MGLILIFFFGKVWGGFGDKIFRENRENKEGFFFLFFFSDW